MSFSFLLRARSSACYKLQRQLCSRDAHYEDGCLSIITVEPNASVAPAHNRMPLVLGPGESIDVSVASSQAAQHALELLVGLGGTAFLRARFVKGPRFALCLLALKALAMFAQLRAV